jgi:acyl-CoA reductase-like NAD-dependent aldehyde dehydrogenase
VILKPSEVTPLSSLLMAEMLAECSTPADVFQVATGDGEAGAALVQEVDCVAFTGSTSVGRLVAKAAAERLIPCHLELGGKDPMIVCADADVAKAANAAAYCGMHTAGQACSSIERVYVEAPIYEEFVKSLTAVVSSLRQGSSGGPGTAEVGAVSFPPQLEIIKGQVNDAIAKGARVLTGGHSHTQSGRYYEPTLLVDVDHTMAVMQEETFGPVIPIMRVADVERSAGERLDS